MSARYRHYLAAIAVVGFAGTALGQVSYPLSQTRNLVVSAAASPYVAPTASALAYTPATPSAYADYIIGMTPGTAGGGYTWFGTNVPSLEMLAFRVTDFTVNTPKTKVIITGGQHADEQHSLYVLQGFVNFLLSADAAAASIRTKADIFVYPQINPEGNWAPNAGKSSGIGFQPEHPTEDMNRFWNVADVPSGTYSRPWSNTIIARDAMRLDTQSTGVGFVFDLHTPGPTQTGKPFIFASATDAASPFGAAITAENRFSFDVDPGETGMLRTWSKTAAAQGGLGAQYAFTPEIHRQSGDAPATYESYGQSLAMALYSALSVNQPEAPATGTEYRIDFHNRLLPGSGWNVITAAMSNSSPTLLDATGVSRGASIALPTLLASTADGWNQAANPLPTWAVLNAADDYLFTQSDTTMLLSGLGANRYYDLELIMARDLNRTTTVTVGENTVAWNEQLHGYQNGDTVLFANVFTGANGQILLSFDIAGTSGAFNALRLVDVTPVSAVPEPASLAVLGLGVVALLPRRRLG